MGHAVAQGQLGSLKKKVSMADKALGDLSPTSSSYLPFVPISYGLNREGSPRLVFMNTWSTNGGSVCNSYSLWEVEPTWKEGGKQSGLKVDATSGSNLVSEFMARR